MCASGYKTVLSPAGSSQDGVFCLFGPPSLTPRLPCSIHIDQMNTVLKTIMRTVINYPSHPYRSQQCSKRAWGVIESSLQRRSTETVSSPAREGVEQNPAALPSLSELPPGHQARPGGTAGPLVREAARSLTGCLEGPVRRLQRGRFLPAQVHQVAQFETSRTFLLDCQDEKKSHQPCTQPTDVAS